jgi:hypothetical protein
MGQDPKRTGKLMFELAQNSAKLLEKIHSQMTARNFNEAFAKRHARFIASVCLQAVELEDRSQNFSSPVLIRSAFDSLFSLIASLEDPQFAQMQGIAVLEFDSARIKKLKAGVDASGLTNQEISEQHVLASKLSEWSERKRAEMGISPNKSLRDLIIPGKCAVLAKLSHVYHKRYADFSQFTHNSIMAELFHDSGVSSASVLNSASEICLIASGKLLGQGCVPPQIRSGLAQELGAWKTVIAVCLKPDALKEIYRAMKEGKAVLPRGQMAKRAERN